MDDIKKLAIKTTLLISVVKGVVYSIFGWALVGGVLEKLTFIIFIITLASIVYEFLLMYRPNMTSYTKLKEKYGRAFTDLVKVELEKGSMSRMLQRNWFILKCKEDMKVGLNL